MEEGFEVVVGQNAVAAAPALLGWELVRELPEGTIRGRIIETEAYFEGDEASHSSRGKTARNAAMFEAGGLAYVYFTYGLHYCCNVVVGAEGRGEAVLIRSLELLEGVEIATARRGGKLPLVDGPAKLCQALGIDLALNGHDLRRSPLRLLPGPVKASEVVVVGPRIGISKAVEAPYRFRLIA